MITEFHKRLFQSPIQYRRIISVTCRKRAQATRDMMQWLRQRRHSPTPKDWQFRRDRQTWELQRKSWLWGVRWERVGLVVWVKKDAKKMGHFICFFPNIFYWCTLVAHNGGTVVTHSHMHTVSSPSTLRPFLHPPPSLPFTDLSLTFRRPPPPFCSFSPSSFHMGEKALSLGPRKLAYFAWRAVLTFDEISELILEVWVGESATLIIVIYLTVPISFLLYWN